MKSSLESSGASDHARLSSALFVGQLRLLSIAPLILPATVPASQQCKGMAAFESRSTLGMQSWPWILAVS